MLTNCSTPSKARRAPVCVRIVKVRPARSIFVPATLAAFRSPWDIISRTLAPDALTLSMSLESDSSDGHPGGPARLGRRHPLLGEPGEARVQNGSDDGANDRGC